MSGPDLHPVQLELLRRASPARRFALARSLSASVIALSRDALRRLHPGWTEEEVALEWVRLQYGAELAAAVRRRLGARRSPVT